jgi:hypothetical protein
LTPGSAGSVETLSFMMIRTPTVPFFAFQSAMMSATAGSVGSTGLIRATFARRSVSSDGKSRGWW